MSNGNDIQIGGTGVPADVTQQLADLFTDLDTKYTFKNGSTAAFFHVAAILSQHLGDRRDGSNS